MFITRPKQVPGPSYDIPSILKKMISHNRVGNKPLERIRQAKTFITAKLEGASTPEAKKLSGIQTTESLTQILNSPAAEPILHELSQHEEFRETGIAARLKEMWHHQKVRSVKVDGPAMINTMQVKEDDTDMWKYSMDKVLEIKGHIKKKADPNELPTAEASGGIVFNVLQINE